MLFVANQCDTPAKATAVTEALQSWLSISIPPMKSCSNGPQKQVKSVSFTGAESVRFLEWSPLLLDLVYERSEYMANGKIQIGAKIEVDVSLDDDDEEEEWVMGKIKKVKYDMTKTKVVSIKVQLSNFSVVMVPGESHIRGRITKDRRVA